MNQPTKTILKQVCTLALALVLVMAFTGCDDNNNNAPTNGSVNLAENSDLGSVLVDSKGITLYFYTKDVNGSSSTCTTKDCLDAWPIFYAETITPGTGLTLSDFETITRSDGKKQTMYKGWPLYYFADDHSANEATGEALGNVWFVAKPNYSLMLANAQLVGHDGKNYNSSFKEGVANTNYFVDSLGRTIYLFSPDSKDHNTFTKPDFSNNALWPVFYSKLDGIPSTLKKEDFGKITIAGHSQLTYKGWPLYYFEQDTKRGDNKGISFPSAGVWPIVNAQTAAAPIKPTILLTNNTTLGKIITDKEGRTLYYYSRDLKGNPSACTGGCLTRWPIYSTGEVILQEGSTLSLSDFGSIGDGITKQTTYKGWPLYYYAPNNDGVIEAAGLTAGNAVGNVWYTANPDYNLMVVSGQLVGLDGKNYTSAYVEGTGSTRYFTDDKGRTIYAFANDKKDTNNYTAADLSNNAAWPLVELDITKLPTGMNLADFGKITVHGHSQTTFKGWPLYYFGQDTKRGENKGVSVGGPGKWPVINNDVAAAPL